MRPGLRTASRGARNTAPSGPRPRRSRPATEERSAMPRKGWVARRQVPPDSVYGSDLVQKFISSMMWDGKRSTAQRIFYAAMDQIAKKSNDDPLKIFKKAVENVKPVLEVKTRRVGGANYQVPVEVNPFRRQSLAIRWLLQYSRERAGKTMVDKLAD